jgi:dihydroorotate dehydrogenase electron transfer subunit
MIQIKTRILHNKAIQKHYFRLIMKAPQIVNSAKPGQFVNIRLTDTFEALLRRPFSIHKVKGENIELLYEVVGQGTEILSQKKPGEYLDVIGPSGNGFALPLTPYPLPLIVAGGMGVAPLVFLANQLRAESSELRVIVLIGARTKKQILCEKEFKELGCDVRISTDDGSKGFKGKAVDLLKHLLSAKSQEPSTIYACGPRPMLKEIAVISKRYNLPAQISLEEHMACGIGACLGCAVNTKGGYKRVCKEGPVFSGDEIIW